jgi:Aspartyl/Asparaginyl beta-hydroxylase
MENVISKDGTPIAWADQLLTAVQLAGTTVSIARPSCKNADTAQIFTSDGDTSGESQLRFTVSSLVEERDMSTTFSEPLRGRALFDRIWKFTLRRVLLPVCVLAPFAYFFPKIALFYAACGAYDVNRNHGLNLSTLRRYFTGNGALLWMLSPINVLMDLFSLPYLNKGVYRLEDLPADMQNEVKRFIQVTNDADLVHRVEKQVKQHKRAMIFWRSYGYKVDAVVNVPVYDEPWKYIKTIGLSVFNTKITTSLHFGWLRPTLRLLYNINDFKDRSAYIVVGDTTHYWCDEKLFIFDDTLLHLSANESDQLRYCMFVDILRPTPFPRVLSAVVAAEGFLNKRFKLIALSGWTLLQR